MSAVKSGLVEVVKSVLDALLAAAIWVQAGGGGVVLKKSLFVDKYCSNCFGMSTTLLDAGWKNIVLKNLNFELKFF